LRGAPGATAGAKVLVGVDMVAWKRVLGMATLDDRLLT
jgi:hypothetical protein